MDRHYGWLSRPWVCLQLRKSQVTLSPELGRFSVDFEGLIGWYSPQWSWVLLGSQLDSSFKDKMSGVFLLSQHLAPQTCLPIPPVRVPPQAWLVSMFLLIPPKPRAGSISHGYPMAGLVFPAHAHFVLRTLVTSSLCFI